MVWDTSSPHKSFPCLEAKASETKHVLEPLEQVLKEVLEGEEAAIHTTMCECLHALNQLIKHFDSIGAFLTADEYSTGRDLAKRFFDAYQDLHNWATAEGRKLFHITFKFHACGHMFKNTKYLNFRVHRNFRGTDFVGQISQLGPVSYTHLTLPTKLEV